MLTAGGSQDTIFPLFPTHSESKQAANLWSQRGHLTTKNILKNTEYKHSPFPRPSPTVSPTLRCVVSVPFSSCLRKKKQQTGVYLD